MGNESLSEIVESGLQSGAEKKGGEGEEVLDAQDSAHESLMSAAGTQETVPLSVLDVQKKKLPFHVERISQDPKFMDLKVVKNQRYHEVLKVLQQELGSSNIRISISSPVNPDGSIDTINIICVGATNELEAFEQCMESFMRKSNANYTRCSVGQFSFTVDEFCKLVGHKSA